jgi:hypothetical protein
MSCPTCSWYHTSFPPAVACYLRLPVADLAPQPPRVLVRGTPPERLVTAPGASRFKGGFRNGRTTLRKPPGRPRKHDDNGDRQRAYRARKKQARVAANEALLTGAPA